VPRLPARSRQSPRALEVQTVAANRASFLIGPVTDEIRARRSRPVADRFHRLGLIPKPITVRDIVLAPYAELNSRQEDVTDDAFVQRLLSERRAVDRHGRGDCRRSYGQDKVVRIGFQKYGKLVLLKSKGTLEEKLKAAGYKVDGPSSRPVPAARSAQMLARSISENRRSAADLRAGRGRADPVTSAYEPPARRRGDPGAEGPASLILSPS